MQPAKASGEAQMTLKRPSGKPINRLFTVILKSPFRGQKTAPSASSV
jgi:hypothetical protein